MSECQAADYRVSKQWTHRLFAASVQCGFTASITNWLMGNISKTGLFDSFHKSKLLALEF
jgi:hypothetical protein